MLGKGFLDTPLFNELLFGGTYAPIHRFFFTRGMRVGGIKIKLV